MFGLTLHSSDQYIHRRPVPADGTAKLPLLLLLHRSRQLAGGLVQVTRVPSVQTGRRQREQLRVVAGGNGSI